MKSVIRRRDEMIPTRAPSGKRGGVVDRWQPAPVQIGEHVRRANFRTRINMACIRKVGHTCRCISPCAGKHRWRANGRGYRAAGSGEGRRPKTVKRKGKIHGHGRIYSTTFVTWLDRSWLKVKPYSGKRASLVPEQIYSVIEQRFSTGFQLSKDVDPAADAAVAPRPGPYPDSSYIPLYPTAPHSRHRDASARFHVDIDFLIRVRWNWYSSSPEYPQALESLKKYFLPGRSSSTCPWNGQRLTGSLRISNLVVTVPFRPMRIFIPSPLACSGSQLLFVSSDLCGFDWIDRWPIIALLDTPRTWFRDIVQGCFDFSRSVATGLSRLGASEFLRLGIERYRDLN